MTAESVDDRPTERTLPLNGLAHRVLWWDAPAGTPTLLALHGWLDLGATFLRLAPALRARTPLRIVAPDLRGHGGTEHVGAGGYYHFADYVADMADLVEQLPRPLFLLGHSMGGTVASLVAGTFPERVDRLVLAEGLGPSTHDTTTPPERMFQWIREVRERRARPPTPMPTLEAARDRLLKGTPSLGADFALELARASTREVDGGFVWTLDPLHRTRSPAPFSVETYRTFLRRIACPVLFLEGENSGFRGWIEDDRLDELARVERRVIPGAGHMLHHDALDAVVDAVAPFLAAGA